MARSWPRIWPSRHENVRFYGTHSADGYRPLRAIITTAEAR